MRTSRSAFGLIDVVGACSTLVVGGLIVVATVQECGRQGNRERCADHLGRIALACKIYANDNNERWPAPPFAQRALLEGIGIDYLNHDRTTRPPNADPGEVGYLREYESTSETRQFPEAGSKAVSITRSFWILARSRHVEPADFVCPSSGDRIDPTAESEPFSSVEYYYDFTSYTNIS